MSLHRRLTQLTLAASVGLLSTAALAAGEIPGHPRDLSYGELRFEVPNADSLRHELSNGIPVYVVEDHSLPLVDLSITLRTGEFLETEESRGVAGLTGSMIRQGGTERLSAEEFDEQVDFLAARMSTSGGSTSSGASLNCLSNALDDSLDLFFEMLKTPGFQADRLGVVKGNLLEGMKQRNDDPRTIAAREWSWLLRGRDHFSASQLTAAELEQIDGEALADFHRRYWRPEQMIVAVSGAVDTTAILADLERRLNEWPAAPSGTTEVTWPPTAPEFEPAPGIYHVEKDIPQGRVSIGHLTTVWEDWSDPEAYAAMVMNEILGGGGFISRITKRIRSDEGLAYSAGSGYNQGTFWPGTFTVGYQSKNPTVALAAKIALEEITRIQDEPVSDEELATAKASFIDTFPRRFESAAAVARTFARDEYIGRSHDYWYHYRDRFAAVDKAAVQKAAQERLRPEDLVMLIVGPWEEIGPGDADQRADMSQILGGEVNHLPLRDPLTLEAMP